MSKKSEFKEVIDENSEKYFVKDLGDGSEIHKVNNVRRKGDTLFYCYKNNHSLGWTGDQKTAEIVAKNGYVVTMEEASELSLWETWNDAVNSGATVLIDENQTQYMSLGFNIIMS